MYEFKDSYSSSSVDDLVNHLVNNDSKEYSDRNEETNYINCLCASHRKTVQSDEVKIEELFEFSPLEIETSFNYNLQLAELCNKLKWIKLSVKNFNNKRDPHMGPEAFFHFFRISIHLNNKYKRAEDDISILFHIIRYKRQQFLSFDSNYRHLVVLPDIKFQATVSLIDLQGNFRFSQSFEYELLAPTENGYFPIVSFGFPRFLKRSTIVTSDLTSEDKLTIHFEIKFASDNFPLHRIYRTMNDFKPYSNQEEKDEEDILNLETSTLWNNLCEKSPYFRALFKDILRNDRDLTSPFKRSSYKSDQDYMIHCDLFSYIMNNNLDHLTSHFTDYLNLYEYADQYELLDLMKTCSNYMKSQMDNNKALLLLIYSDLHSDIDLKEYVTQYILSHWKELTEWSIWKHFKNNRIDLYKELETRKNSDNASGEMSEILEVTSCAKHTEFYQ